MNKISIKFGIAFFWWLVKHFFHVFFFPIFHKFSVPAFSPLVDWIVSSFVQSSEFLVYFIYQPSVWNTFGKIFFQSLCDLFTRLFSLVYRMGLTSQVPISQLLALVKEESTTQQLFAWAWILTFPYISLKVLEFQVWCVKFLEFFFSFFCECVPMII